MDRTDTDLDPTTFGADGFWLNGRWRPIISGGSEDDPGDGGSTEGGNSGDAGDTGDGSGGAGQGAVSDEDVTFTEAQQKKLDAIVAREKAKASRGRISPSDLGFATAKEAADFIEAAKKAEAENLEEGEKLFQEAVEEAKKEAKAEILDRANMRLVKAEFVIEASKHDVLYPEDAFQLVQALEAWDGVEIDDDGNVSGIDKGLFEDLKKAKPFLFRPEGGAGGDIGAGARSSGSESANREEDLRMKYPALGGRRRVRG